jgi:hypothetical protein
MVTMHRSETYDRVACAECRAEVSLDRDRAYSFGEDDALCFACAMRRGGHYDELHDRWQQAPSLEGLHLAPQP